mmetsp:Transcript_30662/g.50986  ORF Transcript_30662/g.50986 Transcript_30662/m.50986 type:complete len:159 (-) Transcript_30662:1430-1906(-)|eukprot:CAMPEP_0178758238 /NCGR_PEP_ID=MMETSP0744-20121128/14255_1 /TAXON_ID=913974 /ORGANISM="Nitzschia punctata, Strain CCMP561" /LENGTH=158 /DNA_ID=CAMNT_0020412541 /DNA_START=299 /DNA_END=775 /DNA_ORIENTATION=-
MASCWTSFRRNGIKSAKSLVATAADLASDWVFYLRIQQNGPEQYELYLFIFCIISSFMAFLLVLSLISNARQNRVKTRQRRLLKVDSFNTIVKSVLALEIVLEDIPQFVLTTLVTVEVGQLTPYAVFNITLSAMNFILNLLDMIELESEEGDEASDVL